MQSFEVNQHFSLRSEQICSPDQSWRHSQFFLIENQVKAHLFPNHRSHDPSSQIQREDDSQLIRSGDGHLAKTTPVERDLWEDFEDKAEGDKQRAEIGLWEAELKIEGTFRQDDWALPVEDDSEGKWTDDPNSPDEVRLPFERSGRGEGPVG